MNIPKYEHQIVNQDGIDYYICPINTKQRFRKTPEETVRQDVIKFLHKNYGYPYILMDIEHPLSAMEDSPAMRIDTMVFMPTTQVIVEDEPMQFYPYIIIECKNRNIKIKEEHIEQGKRYCSTLHSYYLMVTNGIETLFYSCDDNYKYHSIKDIPTYEIALQEEWIPEDFDLKTLEELNK